MLSIGLMSGTSMDGIDVALLQTDGSENKIHALGHLAIPYQRSFKTLLKSAEFAVRQSKGDLDHVRKHFGPFIEQYATQELKLPQENIPSLLEKLSLYLYGHKNQTIHFDDIVKHSTELHAQAVKNLLQQTDLLPHQVDVIGYHGQTLFHRPHESLSIIVGDGALLANLLGITVVNDFRRVDMQAGGQGAPFAPLFHQALAIKYKRIPLAVVNCGGIANISLIQNKDPLDLIAYDTGPGNGLIDRLVVQRTCGKEHMDMNGQYGKKGIVNPDVFQALYDKSIIVNGVNFLKMSPPKALDIGDLQLIPELDTLSIEDACATLEAFTADTIINSLNLINAPCPKNWVLAGGGWNNPVIRKNLQDRLEQKFNGHCHVQTADEVGWNTHALEAQIFAYLAVRSLKQKPLSFPGTTQVPMPLTGGHAHLPSQGATSEVQHLLKNNPAVLTGYQGSLHVHSTHLFTTSN